MIKRTIEISSAPAHITARSKQLILERGGAQVASIPCEDLGMVVVDHPETTYSHSALATLVDSEAAVVICGRDHLPRGILLPLADHSQVVWRIWDQISATKPVRKRLWQQLVRAKVMAQARMLPASSVARPKLVELARQVRSGDPSNIEGQAAKIYWQAWLRDALEQPLPEMERWLPFRRDADGDGLNVLLNYGYAIIRAALARALVSAGLLPALGLHHSNRANAFCLADDLIEPLRPMVDHEVRDLARRGIVSIGPTAKQNLLRLLATDVRYAGQTGPFMVALQRYVASLVKCFDGSAQRLEIPTSCSLADTVACGF